MPSIRDLALYMHLHMHQHMHMEWGWAGVGWVGVERGGVGGVGWGCLHVSRPVPSCHTTTAASPATCYVPANTRCLLLTAY